MLFVEREFRIPVGVKSHLMPARVNLPDCAFHGVRLRTVKLPVRVNIHEKYAAHSAFFQLIHDIADTADARVSKIALHHIEISIQMVFRVNRNHQIQSRFPPFPCGLLTA